MFGRIWRLCDRPFPALLGLSEALFKTSTVEVLNKTFDFITNMLDLETDLLFRTTLKLRVWDQGQDQGCWVSVVHPLMKTSTKYHQCFSNTSL